MEAEAPCGSGLLTCFETACRDGGSLGSRCRPSLAPRFSLAMLNRQTLQQRNGRSRMLHRASCSVAAGLLLALLGNPAADAQTPPSATEMAAYRGLHAAAARGNVSEMRRLLASQADPNARDSAGRSPLHVAAFQSQYDAVRTLVAGGADINALENDRYDVITIAAVKDDLEMVKLAIELGGNPRAITSRYEGTALIAAAHLGHAAVVEALAAAGAPLDHINNLGWTALIEAVVLGDGGTPHLAAATALVAAGANTSIGDRDGVTPLQHARRRGYHALAAILE